MLESGQSWGLEVRCYISSQVQVTHISRYKEDNIIEPEGYRLAEDSFSIV